jgi:coniferyl-aldehyde dehydrogenase
MSLTSIADKLAEEPGQPDLATLLSRQQAAFARDINPDRGLRDDRLQRLDRMLERNSEVFADVISRDFGHRSPIETAIAEIMSTRAAIRHARRHLKAWMKPRRVSTRWVFWPGNSRVLRQPLGVVGIIGAWNYPLQLTLSPLVGAIAAGNRAMIKPSELTPLYADALRKAVAECFAEEEVAVVTGDAEIGRAFSSLPFDHLLFTGSTRIGRLVAQAAAGNLTPVTLELGGKSPVIVDQSANLSLTADRLIFAKLFNTGQTCIAPDYALVQRDRVAAFVQALRESASRLYPSVSDNNDYTSIINERHYSRLSGLIEDARSRGARVIALQDGGTDGSPEEGRKLPPTLIVDATAEMSVMQEEIFGPILPIISYDRLDDAIAYVNERPRPLALYWFGSDRANQERVLTKTISGGVTVNDAMMHFLQEDLPFGGIGSSGYGHYHGEHGFLRMSKEKPVFYQSRFASGRMLYPPYTRITERLVRVLAKWA